MLELERSCVYRHRGSYDEYLSSKQKRLEDEGAQASAARNKLARELEWVRRQPKARESKSRSRVEAYEALAAKVSRLSGKRDSLEISASMRRLGSALVRVVGASLDAGVASDDGVGVKPVLRGFSYEFSKKDRLGVVGPNGAGKSTFLRALQAELPLRAGKIETGETVVFGHYEQQGMSVAPETRVLRLVQAAVAAAPGGGASADADERAASRLLGQFLFPPARWNVRFDKLSGGERRRLQLLCVLAKQPNFLLLDEPTNDLDLDSIGVLEEFLLNEYAGVLVVVSHDRYFVDKVTDHLLVLAGDGTGGAVDWQGSFTEHLQYQEAQAQLQQQAQAPPPPPQPQAAPSAPQGGGSKAGKPLSDFERRAMERLEAELEALGDEQAALQEKIDGFDSTSQFSSYTELSEWTVKIDELQATIDEREVKWLELAERA